MLYKGKKVESRYEEIVVIPKGGIDFVFTASPLTKEDEELFEKLCPRPQPPVWQKPNELPEPDFKDASYLDSLKAWNNKHAEYMFVVSLKATKDVVFETVKIEEPSTWSNLSKELEDSGFASAEINAIYQIVIDANGLNSKKIEAATKSFLAGRENQED